MGYHSRYLYLVAVNSRGISKRKKFHLSTVTLLTCVCMCTCNLGAPSINRCHQRLEADAADSGSQPWSQDILIHSLHRCHPPRFSSQYFSCSQRQPPSAVMQCKQKGGETSFRYFNLVSYKDKKHNLFFVWPLQLILLQIFCLVDTGSCFKHASSSSC